LAIANIISIAVTINSIRHTVTITISAVVDRGGTQGLVARPRRRY